MLSLANQGEFTGVATVNAFSSVNQTLCMLHSLGKHRRISWQRCRPLTLHSAFIFWPTILLYDLNAKSFFSVHRTELFAIPVICSISCGLLWLPGASSWLQIRSYTLLMLNDVLADLGHPLPTFRSAFPLASIHHGLSISYQVYS